MRFKDSIEKIEDKLATIDMTLVKVGENLAEHMRRTEVAEKRLDKLDNWLLGLLTAILLSLIAVLLKSLI